MYLNWIWFDWSTEISQSGDAESTLPSRGKLFCEYCINKEHCWNICFSLRSIIFSIFVSRFPWGFLQADSGNSIEIKWNGRKALVELPVTVCLRRRSYVQLAGIASSCRPHANGNGILELNSSWIGKSFFPYVMGAEKGYVCFNGNSDNR